MCRHGSEIGREDDAQLEKVLLELAPTVRDQEWAEGQEPSETFADTLRSRLVDERRKRGVSPPRLPGIPHLPRIPRLALWVSLPAAAAVAVAVIFLLSSHPSGSKRPKQVAAASVPTPSAEELTKSYPLNGGVGGGGGPPKPSVSLIEYLHGGAYPGHVAISGHPSVNMPAHGAAYVLQRPPARLSAYVATLAKRLAITGTVKVSHTPEVLDSGPRTTTYFYVSRGTGNSASNPIRSVAVSQFDGRVIFHNNATDFQTTPGKPVAASDAVRKARLFLQRMGWPGSSMPVLSVTSFAGARAGSPSARSKQVNLGWPGVASSDRPAATLWVAADGSISEALTLPPEAKREVIALRPLQTAWSAVQAGKTPIGVQILTGNLKEPGTATLSTTSLEHVLTSSAKGRMYLVPSYRFGGLARIRGASGNHRWVALVPAVK
jgi:hypothetical protein